MSRRQRGSLMLAGLILALNALFLTARPLQATDEVCGKVCSYYTQCGGTCYICFPNPLAPPGACIRP